MGGLVVGVLVSLFLQSGSFLDILAVACRVAKSVIRSVYTCSLID